MMKQVEYGTLEPVVLEKRPASKKAYAVAAGVLVCFAVLAVSFSTGLVHSNAVVDSNNGRGDLNSVDASVKTMWKGVCSKPSKFRFGVAGFNSKQTKLEAQVQVGPSDHWRSDWNKFIAGMPNFKAGRNPGVGFGVYNFPVWRNTKQTSDFTIPVFVAYKDAKADISAKYLGGTFLGSALLSVPRVDGGKKACTKTTITVSSKCSYSQACDRVLKTIAAQPKATAEEKKWASAAVRKSLCVSALRGDCPFGKGAPLCSRSKGVCKNVANWAKDALHKEKGCCAAVTAYCKDGKKKGCTKYAKAIYARNCDKSFDTKSDFKPKVYLLAGLTDSEKKCSLVCANSCGYVAEKSKNKLRPRDDTFKLCSGCDNSMEKRNYGKAGQFVARCYPGAMGFAKSTCCGISKACKGKSQRDVCNALGEPKCQWAPASRCGKINLQQKFNASPKGCCGGKANVKQMLCCDGKGEKMPAVAAKCRAAKPVKFNAALNGKCPPKPKPKPAPKPAAKKKAAPKK